MTKIETTLPADLVAHLEATWPERKIVERTSWVHATDGDPRFVEQVEKQTSGDMIRSAMVQGLAVFKINGPHWFRRPADTTDRQVLNDANPIPAEPGDIIEALDEADARRAIERDKAATLKRRKTSRTSVGEWEEVPDGS